MIPIAHSGHWATNLIYILPLVIIAAVLGWQKLRDRRNDLARTASDGSADRAGGDKQDVER